MSAGTVPATCGEMIAYLSQFHPSDKVYILPQKPKPKESSDSLPQEPPG